MICCFHQTIIFAIFSFKCSALVLGLVNNILDSCSWFFILIGFGKKGDRSS